jgi:hypothetical protein
MASFVAKIYFYILDRRTLQHEVKSLVVALPPCLQEDCILAAPTVSLLTAPNFNGLP